MAAHGGPRNGAGRKSKAEEMGLPSLIEECIGEEGKKAIVTQMYNQAIKPEGFKDRQMLMNYIYGKPQDNIDITTAGEALIIRFKDAE